VRPDTWTASDASKSIGDWDRRDAAHEREAVGERSGRADGYLPNKREARRFALAGDARCGPSAALVSVTIALARFTHSKRTNVALRGFNFARLASVVDGSRIHEETSSYSSGERKNLVRSVASRRSLS
jgi:hypothetical protein